MRWLTLLVFLAACDSGEEPRCEPGDDIPVCDQGYAACGEPFECSGGGTCINRPMCTVDEASCADGSWPYCLTDDPGPP